MGQTIAEKIFSRKLGRPVEAGEVASAPADLVVFVDLGLHMFRKGWDQLGLSQIKNPDRVAVVFDHKVPADTLATAELHKQWREWCAVQGVTKLGDLGHQGVSHQWVVEQGYARPGMLVINQDSHANTTGGVGCFSTPIGFDIILDLAVGFNWYTVPETIRVRIEGEFPVGSMARDLMHQVNNDLGTDGAIDRCIEFGGSALPTLAMDTRMTLSNMTRKIEAVAGMCPSDAVTQQWYRDRGLGEVDLLASDEDARFAVDLTYTLNDIQVQVAPPPSAAISMPVGDFSEVRIEQGFIGSCAGGRLEDIHAAAEILRGKSVAPGVRLIIGPATQDIYKRASADGSLDVLAQAGALIVSGTCATCYGGLNGLLADGEVCIANSTVNHPGRMGSTSANIYLGSAAVVAASAIEGRIADPRPHVAGARRVAALT